MDDFSAFKRVPPPDDFSAFKRVPPPDDFSAFKKVSGDIEPVSRSIPPPMNVDPREGMDEMDKLIVGFGHTVDRTLHGLAGLMPYRTAYAKDRPVDDYLKQGREDEALYQKYHPGGWGTAGEVTGDVALSALPVARGAQVLTKALGVLPGASLAPLAADVAINASYSALTNPEDRGGAALMGGGGAGAGRMLTKALGRVVQPIQPKNEAIKALVNDGVPLTPSQAGGFIPQQIETRLSQLSNFLHKTIAKAEAKGAEVGIPQLEAMQYLVDSDPRLVSQAAQTELSDAIQRMQPSAGHTVVPLVSLAAFFHVPLTSTAAISSLAVLYGTATGRRYLLGQTPLQQLLRESPELAPHVAQVMRAISTQDGDKQ